ncbi:MAG: hypothetical protein P0Y66_05795 [Candidatus Kaistia colombiensis]|nr:MAG: hypothetical protein P0Y66_05795 [Kaistia sp.]
MLRHARSKSSAPCKRAAIRAVSLRTTLLSLAVLSGWCGSALAADVEQEAPVAAPGWTFIVAPYAWAPSMSGNVGYGDVKADFNVDFSQLLNHLDFAGMGVVEARYDRFSIFSDLLFMKLSADAKLPQGLDAELGTELLQWTPAAAYSVIKTGRGNFDVMAGARLWSVETSLGLSDESERQLNRSHTATWVDAIVGVKGQYSVTDSVFVNGWALAGGGGSTSTWDLLGAVGYKVNDRFQAMAGYRAQGVDYRNGPFDFNAVIQGPILGATIKF